MTSKLMKDASHMTYVVGTQPWSLKEGKNSQHTWLNPLDIANSTTNYTELAVIFGTRLAELEVYRCCLICF